ncbi:MAG TPA: hypothetical protein VE398_02870 [Acidobacteriota bacterium]|jgi:hypothetical protein|nr:hypothetical protein [Acidobacteriota bacterium]
MKAHKLVTLLFIFMLTAASMAQNFDHAQCFPKAAAGGKKSDPVKGVFRIDGSAKQIQFLDKHGSAVVNIKMENVKSIVYERTAKPRYAEGLLIAWPLLFTKSKSHYLTIQYSDEKEGSQYAIIRLDKSNYRDALASLEAQTGRTVQRSEEG